MAFKIQPWILITLFIVIISSTQGASPKPIRFHPHAPTISSGQFLKKVATSIKPIENYTLQGFNIIFQFSFQFYPKSLIRLPLLSAMSNAICKIDVKLALFWDLKGHFWKIAIWRKKNKLRLNALFKSRSAATSYLSFLFGSHLWCWFW